MCTIRLQKAMERFLILLKILVFYQAANYVKAQDSGEWGEWSNCTRTCGTAIRIQERNSSVDVPRKQFKSCLNDPCEEPEDLRAELCATFNDVNHTYTPLNGNSQCLLTCKATLENGEMIVHGPLEALPGTPCSTSLVTDGICVDAICTPVGCDGILGSRKAIDKCGRCTTLGEHNEICTRTNHTSTVTARTSGHVKMLDIPTGASSISIINLISPDLASLMVRSTSGEYLFTVGSPGSKFIAGEAEFTYSVSVIGTNYRESLTTNERVNQSIIIEVYIPSDEVAPSIAYEYYTLVTASPFPRAGEDTPLVATETTFGWVYGPFIPCTDTCAIGVQVSYALCKDLIFDRLVPDIYCETDKPTPVLRHCGAGDCAPRWMAGEWWPCSGAICGRGSQERLVQCVILEANGRERMIDNVLCNTTIRPNDTRQCVVKDTSQCDTQWDVEEWGQCCSDEPLERRVECVSSSNTNSHRLPPFLCSHLTRNDSNKDCEKGPCSNGGCSWVPKRWFMCNNTCGQGLQRRNVRCRNTDGKATENFCCQDQPLPELVRECYDDRSTWCQPEWHIGNWEQCIGLCGENNGERSRCIKCRALNRQDLYITFLDEFCANQTKLAEVEVCTREDPQCVNCEWRTEKWSDCYCPAGVRLRNVICSSGNDDCCFQIDPDKPHDAEGCDCPVDPSSSSSLMPSPTPECTDHPSVDCSQILEDGYCDEIDTDFFSLLCCQTCTAMSQ